METNDDIFSEVSESVVLVEKFKEPKIEGIEIPEAYQVCKLDSDGKREIVDTYKVNRVLGIVPILKAKSKAETLKRIFPKNTFVVIEIIHKVTKSNKVFRILNVVGTY